MQLPPLGEHFITGKLFFLIPNYILLLLEIQFFFYKDFQLTDDLMLIKN